MRLKFCVALALIVAGTPVASADGHCLTRLALLWHKYTIWIDIGLVRLPQQARGLVCGSNGGGVSFPEHSQQELHPADICRAISRNFAPINEP